MQHGFIKVACATPNVRPCDCIHNAEEIINYMKYAHSHGVTLLVYPELCISGYSCGDLFFQEALLNSAAVQIQKICDASVDTPDMLIFVGLPLRHNHNIFNCAAAILNGKILGIVPKTFLPNYNEFYEKRHFTASPDENGTVCLCGNEYPFGTKLIFQCTDMPEFSVAAEICEDLWNPLANSVSHCAAGASIIANLSASNETIGKDSERRALVLNQSARLKCGYVYCSSGCTESTGDLIFSGHNIIAESGILVRESELFRSNIVIGEIDVNLLSSERRKRHSFSPDASAGYDIIPFSMPPRETVLTRNIGNMPFLDEALSTENPFEKILAMQAFGLKKRIEHTASKKVVIGVSGGLDSCLALLVAAKTMDLLNRPHTDIIAVTMPCFGTTSRTLRNAEDLTAAVGATLVKTDISKSVLQHFADINHNPDVHDVVYENSQARERTQVLMDIANGCSGIVIGTGDMSELALGWATYNGDQMSMYAVNASVPKTMVYKVAAEIANASGNEKLKAVVDDILNTPVSPELLPSKDGVITQKTEDIIGPYELHDFFLYHMLKYGFSPSKIYRLATYSFDGKYEASDILKYLKYFYRRFFAQQFKRSCMPDGVKIFSVSLSPRGDWRMPSDACADLWLQEIEEIK